MIVYYPTAYYEPLLPQKPSDAGNVTWTCSSPTPPRSSLFVDQITAMLAARLSLPLKVPGDLVRRPTRGDLALTTSQAGASSALSGTKQYEAGQVLDFTSGAPLELTPQLVAPATEMRHDTNYLDLTQLGFSADEAAALMVQADATSRTLVSQLNDYRQQRADVETQLSSSQLTLNEAMKAQQAIAAILVINPTAGMQDAYDRVAAQIVLIQVQQQDLVAMGNSLADLSQAAQNDLLAASQLVR